MVCEVSHCRSRLNCLLLLPLVQLTSVFLWRENIGDGGGGGVTWTIVSLFEDYTCSSWLMSCPKLQCLVVPKLGKMVDLLFYLHY